MRAQKELNEFCLIFNYLLSSGSRPSKFPIRGCILILLLLLLLFCWAGAGPFSRWLLPELPQAQSTMRSCLIQQRSPLFLAKDEDLFLDKRRCFSTTDNVWDFLHLRTSQLYSPRAGSCGFLVSSGNMHECHWLKCV